MEEFMTGVLGVETYTMLFLNIAKIIACAVVAWIIFLAGTRFMNHYFTKIKTSMIDEELTGFVITGLKTVLKYGLIFIVILISLKIFNVDVIGAEQVRFAGTTIIKIIALIILARIILGIGRQLITHIFEKSEFKKQVINERRRHTLSGLLKNILTYVVWFLTAIMVLENFGIKTSSILAGVGVAGLAVSFGAQSLIKDVITGFFIMFEDQYSCDDFVTAAGVTGYVEVLGLRTTRIKEWTGEVHIIPNGQIGQVKNYSKNNIISPVFMDIAYEEDIDKAIEVFYQEGETAYQQMEEMVEKPEVHGVVELGDSYVRIRIAAPSVPGMQWAVERELTRRFKKALDREGIEIPYPRRVIITKNE